MRFIKNSILFGVIAMILGIIVIFTSLIWVKFDASAYGLNEDIFQETKTFDLLNKTQIRVDTAISDCQILEGNDDEIKVVYYKSESITYTFTESETSLIINQTGTDINTSFDWSFKSLFTWNYNKYRCYIYLPEPELLQIDISSDTGDIQIDDINVNNLRLNVTTGNINIDNCNITTELNALYDVGSLSIIGSDIAKLITIGSTGNLSLLSCEIDDALLSVSNGNVTINNTKGNNINVSVTTGAINTSKLDYTDVTLTVTTGSIVADFIGIIEEYKITVENLIGSANVIDTPTGERTLTLSVATGNISASFDE